MCGDGYKRLHTCNNILFWIFSSYFISSLLLNWISFSRWKRKLHYVDNIFTIFFSKKNNKFRRMLLLVRIKSSLYNSPFKGDKLNRLWSLMKEILVSVVVTFLYVDSVREDIYEMLELIKTGCCKWHSIFLRK